MAEFEYQFIKASTGRTNKGKISAYDEDEARAALISRKRIDPISIIKLPPEPATDNQINYLRDLCAAVPTGLTKSEASDLIDNKLRKRVPAPSEWMGVAARYRIEITRYTPKNVIYDRVVQHALNDSNWERLAEWYAFRVYRSVCNRETVGAHSVPGDPRFLEVGKEILGDDAAFRSLVRAAKQTHTGFRWFGNYKGNTGDSEQTAAYKFTVRALSKKSIPGFGSKKISLVPVQAPTAPQTGYGRIDEDIAPKLNEKAGCLGVLVICVAGFAALTMASSVFL